MHAVPQPSSIAQDAVFRPVRAGNAFEEAVERILQAIRLGVVQFGDRLPAERDLAGRLNVSRETLREAIRALVEAGYVESRRGRSGGTFVTYRPTRSAPGKRIDVDEQELADVLAMREVLEVGAAEVVARRTLAPDERELLRSRLADAEAASLADFRLADSRLHLAIAELSGSTSLASGVADVRTRLNRLLDAIPLLDPNLDHSAQQHRALVGAILARDPEVARAAAREHAEGTAALLRGFLGGRAT
ncbi:FadR/GntR family transcriptional regulator [Tenggerimyces flavus]|uniref:FadR/GntR family transcriptional regulator n=1 Tax=Tenggerimyces flavus TaxID=1708749 RepID=A0ABV7YQ48_9ACTN|nr:FCD domain-containing protein [Tenggerimyces flavus]MBM7784646.1 DNA-binding FadR family transcriptional regulator [Tenggerimyces flavus]